MSAVELAAGNEIERGNEEADPAGDEDGVRRNVIEGRNGRIPLHQDAVDEANRKRFTAKDDDCGGRVSRGVEAESEADSDGDGGGDVAGEGSVEADVHEGIAIGNAIADLDDGTSRAAEGGSGQNPGKRGANFVMEAGEVVTELMDEEDAEQRKGEGPAGLEHFGVIGEPAPGPEVAVAHNGRQAFKEVLHEASAVGGCGENADAEQKQGQAVFAETRARGSFRPCSGGLGRTRAPSPECWMAGASTDTVGSAMRCGTVVQ